MVLLEGECVEVVVIDRSGAVQDRKCPGKHLPPAPFAQVITTRHVYLIFLFLFLLVLLFVDPLYRVFMAYVLLTR